MSEPRLIGGGLVSDDRGEVGFINDFKFEKIKRFYWVANHKSGFVRAWHAHKQEEKYVTVVQGTALIGAVQVSNWDKPSKESKVWRFILSGNKPSIFYIPAGYANGFMSLTSDAKLIFFSTSTLEESRKDDIRYDAYYWNPWEIKEC
jgi:dTDP-4-dehydrorhamnose 3,5-epimerase